MPDNFLLNIDKPDNRIHQKHKKTLNKSGSGRVDFSLPFILFE